MPDMKYEPTSGHYLSRCGDVISRSSHNPFGDRALFLQAIFFDYLIGNCDNHLKNHSILWNKSWREQELSPLYDITCTTIYPNVYLEMGIALCESRRIDAVTPLDLEHAACSLGLSTKIGKQLYAEVWRDFLPALDRAEESLVSEGFAAARAIAGHIRNEFARKLAP